MKNIYIRLYLTVLNHISFIVNRLGEGDDVKLDSDEEETVPDPEPAEKDENTSNPFETVQPPKPVEDPKPQISVSSHSSSTGVKVTPSSLAPKEEVCIEHSLQNQIEITIVWFGLLPNIK